MESSNLKISQALLRWLSLKGVQQIVVCPGSRNAPLIFSLQASKQFEIFHHHDERGAAFFALGLAMASAKKTAILTTSGTAAAELLPAAIEAYYQKVPLILITADRPQKYRGTGAPQAIEQMGIFSQYANSFDVVDEDTFPKCSSYPLHLNICLEEPTEQDWITGPLDLEKGPTDLFRGPEDSCVESIDDFCRGADDLLVIAGSLSPQEGLQLLPFLKKLKAPLLADSTSNIPPGEYSLKCGEKLLRKWRPSQVLRLGGVPSFRFWRDLETNDLQVMNVMLKGCHEKSFSGLGRPSQDVLLSNLEVLNAVGERKLNSQIFDADTVLSRELESLLGEFPYSEVAFIRKLSSYVKNSALYLGNSLPIREWSLLNPVNGPTFGNRGANGIDGQISSFFGLANSYAETWAVVGDQTALYDLNSLALTHQKSKRNLNAKRRIVIMNNGGGKIFSHLNYSGVLDASQRKILENQHRWEFQSWAEMFAWDYQAWNKDNCLIDTQRDDIIVEIFPDSTQSHHFWSEWRRR